MTAPSDARGVGGQGLARGDYVEHYVKGPVEEPDHTRWETELAYLTTA